MKPKFKELKNKLKNGSAALSWAIVIALSIALVGIAFPRIQRAVEKTNEPIAEEVGTVIDTSNEQPIIRHKSTDSEK